MIEYNQTEWRSFRFEVSAVILIMKELILTAVLADSLTAISFLFTPIPVDDDE